MAKQRWLVGGLGLMFLLVTQLFLYSGEKLSVEDIVERNIQAAGGKEKLAEVKNYSFKSEPTEFYLSSDGRMKIVEGKKPVITEVILVDRNKVRRNCFNEITEVSGLQKSTYVSLAKLRSGLFTLEKFKDQLEYRGIKNFGSREFLMLETDEDDLKVEFYLDPEKFLLKRIVFRGFDSLSGKYEVSHDMGSYQDLNGVKIPSSWFGSRVGTRGRIQSISQVRVNLDLEKEFFSSLEINAGEAAASQGSLQGNIIDFHIRGENLYITTNWTARCIRRAGFKTADRLVLKVKDIEIGIDFYTTAQELPPRDDFPHGARLMFLDERRGETYMIYFYRVEFAHLAEALEPLLPIQVERKL